MLGQILGVYEIQQDIGRGPAATVYTARQHPVESRCLGELDHLDRILDGRAVAGEQG